MGRRIVSQRIDGGSGRSAAGTFGQPHAPRLLVIIAGCLLVASASARADIEVDLSLAALVFADDAWDPQQSLSSVAAGVRWTRPGWPIHLEARYRHARSRSGLDTPLPVGHIAYDLLLETLGFGVVKEWGDGTARPFAGGGIEAVKYRRDQFDNDFPGGKIQDDGTVPGAYAHGGILWRMRGGFTVGVEGKLATGAMVTLTDVEIVPNVSFSLHPRDRTPAYGEVALRIGWSWPGK